MKQPIVCLVLAILVSGTFLPATATAARKTATKHSSGGREPIKALKGDPYVGAIAVDTATGKVIFEDNADGIGYPASMVKLMDLLIILEKIEKGQLKLDEKVTVTPESSTIGGSGVYLKDNEVFSIEELLYAMAIQSANDAATALAIHTAGSKAGFVKLMNTRAAELGMKSTTFASVHGLPPAKGQQPDLTTARDMALLACELVKHPEVFRYTSAKQRVLRANTNKPFIMSNHNHLLLSLKGCDGFKTGYITAAGFSITATALRNDRRVVAVVLGSVNSEVRDENAREIINSAFVNLPPLPPPQPVITNTVQTLEKQPAVDLSAKKEKRSKTMRIAMYIGLFLVGIAVVVRLFKLASITHN